ncbi:MAG: hypothetical protein WC802_01460 [Patescibacteria group bacterium]|jgi:hypothetical protein
MGILRILEERERAVRESAKELEKACVVLRARIPGPLQHFAEEVDWLATATEGGTSQLALFLERVVTASKHRTGVDEEIRKAELGSFGFSSIRDAKEKLKILANAWAEVIKIAVIEHETDGIIIVRFTSAEVKLEPRSGV